MIAAGIVAIVAYISASCFLSVIEMVIDTLFLCFAHDNDNVTKSNGSEDYADVHFKVFQYYLNCLIFLSKVKKDLRRAVSFKALVF